MELLSQAAWPCRLVDDRGAVAGFVMPAIPDPFFVQMRKNSGMSRETAEVQHLLNDDSFLARHQLGVSDRRRYELLGEVARALSVFHRHGIAVGDLSPKNLLYSPQAPGVYFIDCDAMRFQDQSVLPQLETPDWNVRAVNPREELGTVASDSYKLGLLALRLLVGNQNTRDLARLPGTMPAAVRQFIEAALSPDPACRPKPADWITVLEAAAASASTKTPQGPTATVPAAPITGERTRTTPPAADPLIGEWNVTYGAPTVVTITLAGGVYTETGRLPVRLQRGSIELPPGTVIATFTQTGPRTYAGRHGLWNMRTGAFITWADSVLRLSSDGNTMVAHIRPRQRDNFGGDPDVTYTRARP